MSIAATIATSTNLAEVIDLRPATTTRPLSWREYTTQPPRTARDAVRGWQIEEALTTAWDQQTSPYDVLAVFAPGVDAGGALDALFDAADEVHAAEMQAPGSGSFAVAADRYVDALGELARVLRGVKRECSL